MNAPALVVEPAGVQATRRFFALGPWAWPSAAVLAFAAIVTMNAWLSDDAYITLRTIDNFVHGYGLRWNIAERVQAYTHPLWLFLLSGPYALTGDHYFTSIATSLAVSISAATLLGLRAARSAAAGAAGVVLLAGSKAFVDFSTSGLENPLSHLLLFGFFAAYWCRARSDNWLRLTLVASLCLLTRTDLGLLILPALMASLPSSRPGRSLQQLATGVVPLLAWHTFSLVYYGFPVPNTAYAKVVTDVPVSMAIANGLNYLLDSLRRDPLTLSVIALGLVVPPPSGRAGAVSSVDPGVRSVVRRLVLADWSPRLGILLYLVYVLWIGGDFMTGRFLTAPFFVATLRIVRWLDGPSATRPIILAVVGLLVAALSATPTFLGNYNYRRGESVTLAFGKNDISDERRAYWQLTGLFSADRWNAEPSFKRLGEMDRRNGTRVNIRAAVGLHGFFAGPGLHLVDAYGLGDPLLARLPPAAQWRIGHYRRDAPAGYLETLATGRNVIQAPGIHVFYDHLASITRGPIWSRRRFREILLMNLGRYDYLISSEMNQPAILRQ